MNRLGDNYLDKHRYRPKVVIPGFQLYFCFAGRVQLVSATLYLSCRHLPPVNLTGNLSFVLDTLTGERSGGVNGKEESKSY